MVRVDQEWARLMKGVPHWRLLELAQRSGAGPMIPAPGTAESVERFLESLGLDLAPARAAYARMGGAQGAERAGTVGTSFKALAAQDLDALHDHALWQVHALKAIYWE
jgi:hypothetical protein